MEEFKNTVSINCARGMMTCVETLRTWITSTIDKYEQLKGSTKYLERCQNRMKGIKSAWSSFTQHIRDDEDTISSMDNNADKEAVQPPLVLYSPHPVRNEPRENHSCLPFGANKMEGKPIFQFVAHEMSTTDSMQKRNKLEADTGIQCMENKEEKLRLVPSRATVQKSSTNPREFPKHVTSIFKMLNKNKSSREHPTSPNKTTQFTFTSPDLATNESPSNSHFVCNTCKNIKLWLKQDASEDATTPTDDTYMKAAENKGEKPSAKKQRMSPNCTPTCTWMKQEIQENNPTPTDESCVTVHPAQQQQEKNSPTIQPSSPNTAVAKRKVWATQQAPERSRTPTQDAQKTAEYTAEQPQCTSPNSPPLNQNHVTSVTGNEMEESPTLDDLSTEEDEKSEYSETGEQDNVSVDNTELKLASRYTPTRRQRRRTTNSDSRGGLYPLPKEKHPKALSADYKTYSSRYYDEDEQPGDAYAYAEQRYQYVSEIKTQKMKNKFTSTQDDGSGFCSIIKGRPREDLGDLDLSEDEDENSKSVQVNLDGESDSLEVGGCQTSSEPSGLFSSVRGQFEIATYRMDDRVEEQRGVKGVRVNVPQGKVKRRGVANKHLGSPKPSFNLERFEHWDEELLPTYSDPNRDLGDKAARPTGISNSTRGNSKLDARQDSWRNQGQTSATKSTPDRPVQPDIRHYCEVPVKVLQKKNTDDDLVAAYGGGPRGKKNKTKGRRRDRKSSSQTRGFFI